MANENNSDRDGGFDNGYTDFQLGYESKVKILSDNTIVRKGQAAYWSVDFCLGYVDGFMQAEADNH